MSKPVPKPHTVVIHYLKDGERVKSSPIPTESHGQAVRLRREARSLYGDNLLHVSIEADNDRAP